MRPREERRGVIINSRMRIGMRWLDVRILNLSTRGAGLTSTAPPDLGAYVEIRRGAHVLIARVVWVNGLRFGVRTQDPVPVQSLIHDLDPAHPSHPAEVAQPLPERRNAGRSFTCEQYHSRALGRSLEFTFLVLLAISAACIGFGIVGEALRQPFETVRQALSN